MTPIRKGPVRVIKNSTPDATVESGAQEPKTNETLLSILIPTHNRIKKLHDALKSIRDTKIPFKYEIIINDDTLTLKRSDLKKYIGCDFILTKQISPDISGIYKTLFRTARGKYLWYLEDDDQALAPLPNIIKAMESENIDLMLCNYIDYKGLNLEFTKTEVKDFGEFCLKYNHYDLFQLSRFVFKKSICFEFPRGNNLLNDWHLFTHLRPQKFATCEYLIYKQNVDETNISFDIKEPYFEDPNALMVDLSAPYNPSNLTGHALEVYKAKMERKTKSNTRV